MPEKPQHIGEQPPEGYEAQRERVVQLLKDYPNPYATNTSCNPAAGEEKKTPEIPPGEVSDGYWNMTPEMERQIRMLKKGDVYVKSHQLLADELALMKLYSIHYYALAVVFLGDTADYWSYESLTTKATKERTAYLKDKKKLEKRLDRECNVLLDQGQSKRTIVRYATKAHLELRNRYPDIRLLEDLEIAIYTLTMRLLDVKLEVIRPTKAAPTNNRRISMEEKYREIYRVFSAWCDEISKTSKAYRNKAYAETVMSMNETRSTVERAVFHVEAGEPKITQSTKRTVKKTRCQTFGKNDEATVRSHKTTVSKEKV